MEHQQMSDVARLTKSTTDPKLVAHYNDPLVYQATDADVQSMPSVTLFNTVLSLHSHYSDLPDDYRFAVWTYIIITAVCIITAGVLLYITIQVIKRVWDADKIIPLMLFNL